MSNPLPNVRRDVGEDACTPCTSWCGVVLVLRGASYRLSWLHLYAKPKKHVIEPQNESMEHGSPFRVGGELLRDV